MRPDMKQVIIERPRVGGKGYRPKPPIFDDDAPKRGKMKPCDARYEDRKEQTDLLGPLRRFLRSNVGRPWNDIWSEICQHNQDHMGQHLRNHVEGFVYLNVTRQDGNLYSDTGYRINSWSSVFYVDPDDGILRFIPKPPRKRTKRISKFVEVNGQKYFYHEGIWYRVRTKPIPKPVKRRRLSLSGNYYDDYFYTFRDAFLGNVSVIRYTNHYQVAEFYGESGVYVEWKQQANSREIRKLKKVAGESYKKVVARAA